MGRAGRGVTAQERVAAFDASTGELLWEDRFNVFHTTIPFNRVGWASLAADPQTGRLYAHGVQGLFRCYSRDGELLWEHSLTEEFGRISGYGGRVQTPVVAGGLVILNFLSSGWGAHGVPRDRYFAFDKHTGEVVWVAAPGGRPLDTTYSTPVVADIGGQRLLIAGNADGSVYAMRLATGEKVWGIPLEPSRPQRRRRGRRRPRLRQPRRGERRRQHHGARGLHRRPRPRGRDGHPRAVALRRPVRLRLAGLGRRRPLPDRQLREPARPRRRRRAAAVAAQSRHRGQGVPGGGRRQALRHHGERRFHILRPGETGGELLDSDQVLAADGGPAEIFGSRPWPTAASTSPPTRASTASEKDPGPRIRLRPPSPRRVPRARPRACGWSLGRERRRAGRLGALRGPTRGRHGALGRSRRGRDLVDGGSGRGPSRRRKRLHRPFHRGPRGFADRPRKRRASVSGPRRARLHGRTRPGEGPHPGTRLERSTSSRLERGRRRELPAPSHWVGSAGAQVLRPPSSTATRSCSTSPWQSRGLQRSNVYLGPAGPDVGIHHPGGR